MKGKLVFLVLLAFILCGCTANVNISINDNVISERININEAPYGEATINDIAQQYRKFIPAFSDTIIVDTMPDVASDGVKYYQTSGTEINGSYNAHYQYDYNFREYKNATSLNNAFKSSTIQYDAYEKKILVSTESSGIVLFNSYPELEEIRINISTNYKVLENNADYNSGNVYTWVFNKNTKKGVYLLLEDLNGKSIKENESNTDNKKDNDSGNKENNNNDKENNNQEGGQKPVDNGSKKEEKEDTGELTPEKIREEGTKHPYVVVIIGIVVLLIVVFASFRIKKV